MVTKTDSIQSGDSHAGEVGLTVNYGLLPELVGHNLGIAYVMICQVFSRVFAEAELTPKQFVALEFIAHNPHTPQKDVAHHIGTTPTVMVAITDYLSKRGFVERVPSEQDRRQQLLRATEEGTQFLNAVRQLSFDVEDIFAKETGLESEERETLLKILRKITKR